MSARREVGLFALASLAGCAALALAPLVVPDGAVGDPVFARSLLGRWLPYALALATLLTALLAWRDSAPRPLLARTGLLWLAVPATGALMRFGDHVEPFVYGLPYVLVVAVIAAGAVAALRARRDHTTDRALGLLLGAAVALAALALLPYDRTLGLPQSDEPHYLLAMQSLVRDRDLDLTNDYDGPYEDLYGGRLPDRHVVQVGNAQRPIHDLGIVALGVLPFAVARRTGVLVLICLLSGVFAWRGFALLRRLGVGRDAAILATGAVALLHPLFTYSTQVYPDLPAALATLLVADALSAAPTARRLAFASALCGTLVWLTVRSWPLAGGLGLVIAIVALRSRRLGLVLAGALPFVAVVGANALADQAMFGVLLPNAGYFAIRDQQTVLAFTPQLGIPGLLVDRAFGLLARSPLYALAFLGAVPLWRRARALGSAAVAALALGGLFELLYVGDVAYWWSDGSPSSRYLLSGLGLWLCALACGLERLRGDVPRLLALAAAAWSAAVTFFFALVPGFRYDIAADLRGGSPGELWTHLTFVLRANPGLLFPSMVRAAPIDAALAVVWLVALGALVVVGARQPEREAGRIL